MDRALFKLMRLQARAAVRRALRGVRTPRGAVFFAVGIVVFGLWLGPVLLATFVGSRPARAVVPADPQRVREIAPALLLVFCVLSMFSTGDKAISFTPGEVNFLFAGPFTRRQLLGYKLTKAALGMLVTSLFLSLVLRRHAASWAAALVGTFLSLTLMHLFATCLLLVGQTVTRRAYTFGRRAVLFVVVAAAAVALRPVFTGAAGPGEDFASLLHRFSVSPGGRVLLAPFQPFTRAFLAERLVPDLLVWGAAAAAVNLGLFALMMWLDASYLEAAIAASERAYERAQRLRRGEWAASFGRGGAGGLRLTRLGLGRPPWLGGAGPVAWRQLVSVSHRSASLLLMVAVYAGVIAVTVVAGRRGGDPRGVLFPAAAWLTLILAGALKFDFRGDLDQMAWLKSLPLRSGAVAAGQLVTPVLLLTVCHAALFTAGALVSPHTAAAMAALAALALPFNVVLMGVENVLFLLYPARGAAAPGEFSAVGRQVVLFVVKLLAVALACGVAAGAAAAVLALTRSRPAAFTAGFVVLALEAAAVVPVAAWAFRRFDPSMDTPP